MEERTDHTTTAPDTQQDSVSGILMQEGRTTYILNLHFNKDATDTLEDKVKKLIRKDVASGNF